MHGHACSHNARQTPSSGSRNPSADRQFFVGAQMGEVLTDKYKGVSSITANTKKTEIQSSF